MDKWPDNFPRPDQGATSTPEKNVVTISYGDGYEQSVSKGINHLRHVHELTWTGARELLLPVYEWLLERSQVTPFLFSYPDEQERQYKCTELSKTDDQTYIKISAKFRQDFNII